MEVEDFRVAKDDDSGGKGKNQHTISNNNKWWSEKEGVGYLIQWLFEERKKWRYNGSENVSAQGGTPVEAAENPKRFGRSTTKWTILYTLRTLFSFCTLKVVSWLECGLVLCFMKLVLFYSPSFFHFLSWFRAFMKKIKRRESRGYRD